ncbi:MAG: DUF3592 domain-containing protein [Akkermansia sp.]|nr:DUF3592 domain-containing protein [Akkermansia sp.]
MSQPSHKSYSLKDWLLCIIITLVGGVVLALGVNHYCDALAIDRQSVTTEAQVIDIESFTSIESGLGSKGSRGSKRKVITYSPVVQYTDADGRLRTAKSKITSQEYNKYRVGDILTITYHPRKPSAFIIAGDNSKAGHIFCIAVGAILSVLGCSLLAWGLKK